MEWRLPASPRAAKPWNGGFPASPLATDGNFLAPGTAMEWRLSSLPPRG
ncbi:MAG: hypothetical protein HDS39_00605 [Bacteroides sp.]|nr:hypothetical protein [Bacteroides sp.]